MEKSDPNLRAILNSPAKFSTPAVPTPDWGASSSSSAAPTLSTNIGPAILPKSEQSMLVNLPGAAAGETHTNVTIQNCVSTIDLGCELDLKRINNRTRNSEYNPMRFSGLVMRIREPTTTALIFRSGKIVVTGARNESDALLAAKKFALIIHKLNFNVKFNKFKIQNLVATCDLRFPIKLENLNQVHGQFSNYEPELFPGLIYRLVKPRVVLLIFVNGKIVFTGAKNRQEIKDAIDCMYPILKSFRKC